MRRGEKARQASLRERQSYVGQRPLEDMMVCSDSGTLRDPVEAARLFAKYRVVLCNHNCPHWSEGGADIWMCDCVCGRKITACGCCLVEGRVTSCGQCEQAA
jgi:hypothetical protein